MTENIFGENGKIIMAVAMTNSIIGVLQGDEQEVIDNFKKLTIDQVETLGAAGLMLYNLCLLEGYERQRDE